MSINPSTLIATIINFVILYLILKKFFFAKIAAIIEEREELINEKLDNAEEEITKARILAIENEKILKKAREEGKLITQQEKAKADKIYHEIIEEANEEAKVIILRARKEIAREREKAEAQLKTQVVDLAMELAEKIIEKNIDEDKNRELIEDFITKVGNS
ncbi:F0F1 ATP synthase subunit B [Clostridium isatidis]|mgnify:CR=1 FL=1|uniref:ATP synthase subunit b n=1 Tax=Clostridium isatidis TaxID=182773 RepID=A0A343JEV1_9CLOT|nr:F0F1 ATP synthase subunit B [Clostridium isatidis]ASW44059.1 ATP synthase F0 subunit B [Clostridium isatidis]NLZ35721.1 F0F1 ATP synthase subunit B [Clostridiales bacterium]